MRMQGNRPTAWFPTLIAFQMSLKSLFFLYNRQTFMKWNFGHRSCCIFYVFEKRERKKKQRMKARRDFLTLSNCCLNLVRSIPVQKRKARWIVDEFYIHEKRKGGGFCKVVLVVERILYILSLWQLPGCFFFFFLFLWFRANGSRPSLGGKAIDRTFLLASLGENERRRRASSEPPTTLTNRPFNLLLIYVP
jgi:hypothetical protein